jgi:hypothetical protein
MQTRGYPSENRSSESPSVSYKATELEAVFRMRQEKPRPRVTAGAARKQSLPAQRSLAPRIGLNFAALR